MLLRAVVEQSRSEKFHQRANVNMGSGGEVATIFHPRRSRAPSMVLNDDQQHATFASPIQVMLDAAAGCEGQQLGGDSAASSCRTLDTGGSITGVDPGGGQGHGQSQAATAHTHHSRHTSLTACCTSCCAESAKKIYFGVCVTICVTASWVGATHCIKYLYFYKAKSVAYPPTNSSVTGLQEDHVALPYSAPFFTTWFCTNWVVLYFPIYFLCRAARTKCNSPTEILAESLRGFRDKGFTVGRFLIRCSLFCGLWVVTNYMYIHSLRILLATDVMALFATNVACVYLLSWVILHEQFVAVRIVAVILCDTGIALFAYMDGITGSPTLRGVVLAASAAAGSAVYKVLFKKVMGETTFGQVSLFFSLIGLCNAALLWPVCLTLYFSGAESVQWSKLPWAVLLSASAFHLVANMLGNFSIALTYDLFITLGLITAVPVSAALDILLYGAHFTGMRLAGMILIAISFFLVMFPVNWPDYITGFLRNIVLMSHNTSITRLRRHRENGEQAANGTSSMPQRHYRLRSYGVAAAHGDGQALLPATSLGTTQQNARGSNANLSRHHQNNSASSDPSRRLPPISSTTSTSTTSNANNRRVNLAASQA
ncbi:solute carrier family 35 member F3 [Prorops nasuta]|uniref:solute carrier family 35 member F3 n=1 Tax=Prorops nasuta TaxID=863751 RepID=UPI0034CE7661